MTQSSNVSYTSPSTFAKDVLTHDQPVLVFFTAMWCNPCDNMDQDINELSIQHEESLRIVKLDVDSSSSLIAMYSIRSIPTMILFIDGQEVHRFSDYRSGEDIVKEIADWIN